jgi:bifunctional DNA-binding transcriptional regulator/antitoxin component of YhaV-PrlF toxin-antitoxin module
MLPAQWRRSAGIGPGSELLLSVGRNGELRIETREQRQQRARALVRKYIPASVSLVEELIRERREEAERESRV